MTDIDKLVEELKKPDRWTSSKDYTSAGVNGSIKDYTDLPFRAADTIQSLQTRVKELETENARLHKCVEAVGDVLSGYEQGGFGSTTALFHIECRLGDLSTTSNGVADE